MYQTSLLPGGTWQSWERVRADTPYQLVLDFWRKGEPVYRPDLRRVDRSGRIESGPPPRHAGGPVRESTRGMMRAHGTPTRYALESDDDRLGAFDLWLRKAVSVRQARDVVAEALRLHHARSATPAGATTAPAPGLAGARSRHEI